MVVVVVISPNINPEIRISWLGGRKGIRPVKTEWWGAGVVVWSKVQSCIWPS